jgi:hypothetical protein
MVGLGETTNLDVKDLSERSDFYSSRAISSFSNSPSSLAQSKFIFI